MNHGALGDSLAQGLREPTSEVRLSRQLAELQARIDDGAVFAAQGRSELFRLAIVGSCTALLGAALAVVVMTLAPGSVVEAEASSGLVVAASSSDTVLHLGPQERLTVAARSSLEVVELTAGEVVVELHSGVVTSSLQAEAERAVTVRTGRYQVRSLGSSVRVERDAPAGGLVVEVQLGRAVVTAQDGTSEFKLWSGDRMEEVRGVLNVVRRADRDVPAPVASEPLTPTRLPTPGSGVGGEEQGGSP